MSRKLRAAKGFTLSELLVVVALVALITAALAAGIPAALNVYHNVTASSEAAVLSSTLMQVVSDELRFGESPAQSAGGTVTFDSATYGGGASFAVDGADEYGAGRLTLGGQPLLAEDAYPAGLAVTLQVGYDGGSETYSVTLAVWREGSQLHTAAFTVEPVDKR